MISFIETLVAVAIFVQSIREVRSQEPGCWVPACCDDDCCGAGTHWNGALCVDKPGSTGYDAALETSVHECKTRSCCEEACCDVYTIYDPSTKFCVPAYPIPEQPEDLDTDICAEAILDGTAESQLFWRYICQLDLCPTTDAASVGEAADGLGGSGSFMECPSESPGPSETQNPVPSEFPPSVAPSGPPSNATYLCGPIIDEWLVQELNIFAVWISAVNNLIDGWADAETPFSPDFIRVKAYQYAFMLLVGPRLTYFPNTKFAAGDCPTVPRCAHTVTLHGKCVHSSEIGNFIYGFVARYFRMTWIQTWGGSIVGNRGKRTDADAAAVELGWDYGDAGGALSQFLSSTTAKFNTMAGDAPAECQICTTAVNAAANHVALPAAQQNLNVIPVVMAVPANVN